MWSEGDKRLLIDELSLSFSIIGSKTYSLAISIEVLLHVSTERTGFYLIYAAPVCHYLSKIYDIS